MATKRMLIDATHPEETRVVVLSGNRLEDFDVEVASRKQLKGNIYLAKVTRVEPSLQAAFIEYGGNRHGFLAFSEIHPDYYQIPVADRKKLVAEYAAEEKNAEAADGDEAADSAEGPVETVGGDDSEEVEARRARRPSPRRYKIQEVVKRRQVLLVQVVKEERGNKGAALTTYLSLAGRYCVLMPNTSRGGGISRKISSGTDRKRLKTIINSLDIPEGIAVIVRTAGADHGKAEFKRDYEYLLRLWNGIRDLTLESTAPCLVHEEGSLIKRTIRDLYSRDIEEIIIDGDEAYRTAKDFMKLLIPSHVRRVKRYQDDEMPMLLRYQVEGQLDATHSPVVQLPAGGYIVINSTEALVAIDVNSGRSTRERNIEETALKTNLEAASEVARQLRLRDLAGLIVIDFIDMEVKRNQTQVERRLKDAMATDRARIQLGRISPFGLLELSRQRLRPSLFETTFETCPHCEGTGARRTTESTALYVLRALEEEGMRKRAGDVLLAVPGAVALYILNQKRSALMEIERRHKFTITLTSDDSLIPPDFRLERRKTTADGTEEPAPAAERAASRRPAESGAEASTEEGGKRRRRRSRRRKRSDETVEGTTEEATEQTAQDDASADASVEASVEASAEASTETEGNEEPRTKRRRRGRRGGRRRSAKTPESQTQDDAAATDVTEAPAEVSAETKDDDGEEAGASAKKETRSKVAAKKAPAKKKAATRKRKAPAKKDDAPSRIATKTGDVIALPASPGSAETPVAEAPKKEKSPARRSSKSRADDDEADKTTVVTVGPMGQNPGTDAPRKGWWNRL